MQLSGKKGAKLVKDYFPKEKNAHETKKENEPCRRGGDRGGGERFWRGSRVWGVEKPFTARVGGGEKGSGGVWKKKWVVRSENAVLNGLPRQLLGGHSGACRSVEEPKSDLTIE